MCFLSTEKEKKKQLGLDAVIQNPTATKKEQMQTLPSCNSSIFSTKLLETATSMGRSNSEFLAFISAPNSRSMFTISVLGSLAAACNGVSKNFPF